MGASCPYKCGPLPRPRKVSPLDEFIEGWSSHPKTRRFDRFRAKCCFRLAGDFFQEFRNDRIKSGKLAAFITAVGNLLVIIFTDPIQGEIALRAADIPSQDHLLLPGFASIVPAGFSRGESPGCEGPDSSSAAAASSTRNSFTPLSRGWTCCAGYGGSAFPSSTARRVSAFSRPTTRKTTRSAASSTGIVSVMRRALSFTTIGVVTHRDVWRVTRSEER